MSKTVGQQTQVRVTASTCQDSLRRDLQKFWSTLGFFYDPIPSPEEHFSCPCSRQSELYSVHMFVTEHS